MSSRRRLYLNLKASILSLFKTPAHYLKEITGKQSLYEKPYLDKDYRQMHLNLPVPSWKRPKFDPGGMWPRPRKHTFVFDDGMCTAFSHGGACGETAIISGWISMLPPGSEEQTISWKAVSSDETLVRVISVEPYLGGMSVKITLQLSDTESGTAVVCVSASMFAGSVLKEIAYTVPAFIGGVRTTPGWTPSLEYAFGNLPPIYETRQKPSWDCGCIDFDVVCACVGASWDSVTSGETVARNGSCTVAITDGGSGSKTWSVSGTGFWFDAGHTKTTLTTTANSVTLYADGTACGIATVVACGAIGYVRCTTGQWIPCGSVSIARCVGGASDCLTAGQCLYYIGGGSWISGRYKLAHSKLFGNCQNGVLGSVDCNGVTINPGTVTSAPVFYNSGDSVADPVAYYSRWGC